MARLAFASIFAVGAVLLAACTARDRPYGAAATAGGPRQCFYAGSVTGFRQGPGDIVYLNTNARDYYELRTVGDCGRRLDFEHRIAIRSRGGSFICSGYDAEIIVPDALDPRRCPVQSVRKLTPAEVAVLRQRR